MPTRSSSAEWSGNLARGNGTMSLGSGAFEGSYSFASRFESGEGTNPEELIAAAHAGCFSMALAAALSQAEHVNTPGASTEVKVDGLDDAEFQEFADGARSGCAVSRALAGVEITLAARLA